MSSRWLLAYPRNGIEAKQILLKMETDWQNAYNNSDTKSLQATLQQAQQLLATAREKIKTHPEEKALHQKVFQTFQKWIKNKGIRVFLGAYNVRS